MTKPHQWLNQICVAVTAYSPEGRVIGTWGATYPVFYEFDDYNRMSAMYTLRNTNVVVDSYSSFSSQPSAFDKTTWLYDEATGLLTNKLYADGKGTAYTYTPDGKLHTRTWARGIVTSYAYTNTGEMIGINYSDETPDISFTYDRLGRQKSVVDAQGTRTFSYNDALQLESETQVSALIPHPLTNIITRNYDGLGRSTGFALTSDLGSQTSVSYAYSDVGRFSGLSSVIGHQSSNSWTYSYLANSDLIAGVSNIVAGVSSMRAYEPSRDLITEIHNQAQGSTISKYQYSNDVLGRRTQRIDMTANIVTNDFGYNARSELTNAVMGAENFAWAFDNTGNRQTYTHPTGSGQATNLYAANELNQYTQISNGGLKTLTYDLDGNLVTDGTWSNVWNGENRPVRIEPMNPTNGSERVELAYDYQGRRIKEEIFVYSGSAWSVVRTNLWLYDGWNPVQEVVLTASGIETNWWTHGLDLSGTLQGAGGIGGFLAWTRTSDGKTFLYSGDANGNITELVDANNPTNIVAAYQWDAYGDSISMFGDEAENNVFRWSSKYVIVQTGDKDYGYRILRDHRWVSRDSVEEDGGLLLYGFVRNEPVNYLDVLGKSLFSISPTSPYDDYKYGGKTIRLVRKCNIIIFIEHAFTLPDSVVNEPCSMASLIACDPLVFKKGSEPIIGVPLPGWAPFRKPPPKEGTPRVIDLIESSDIGITGDEAGRLAEKDWQVALTQVDKMCKDRRCCCPSIRIEIKCNLGRFNLTDLSLRVALQGVCGREKDELCKR